MIYTATQNPLFPPLYLMQRFVSCDYVYLMESAQYNSRSHQSRFVLWDQHQDKEVMISLPTGKVPRGTPIDMVEIRADDKWRKKLKATLKHLYGHCDYYEEIMAEVINPFLILISQTGVTLSQATTRALESIKYLGDFSLGATYRYRLAPTKDEVEAENASEWMALIPDPYSGPKTYLAGRPAVLGYLEPEHFRQKGITIQEQNWTMKDYGVGIQPKLSILDPLFRLGPMGTRDWIMS